MRLRLLAAAGITLGTLLAVPASVAAAPAVSAAASAADCKGLPRHSNLPVVDSANAMQPERMAYLTADLMRFAMEEDAAIVAVTVRDLGGDDVASYARRLFDCWGIGKAESNRGVLILVAMRERRVRVEVGKGLAREVDRAALDRAVAAMAAPMKSGDVAGAMRAAATSVATTLGASLPDTVTELETGELPGVGAFPGGIPNPASSEFTDLLDGDRDVPEASRPYAPSPVGDGSWIPKVAVGVFVLGLVLTFARAAISGGMRAGGGGVWRGGFPTFGGGERGWSDPNLLRNGAWSSDGTWRGGGSGGGVLSGSGGSSAPVAAAPSGSGSSGSGSSVFGGGTSGGGGASGTW